MAQYLRFPTPHCELFEPVFLTDASPETQQKLRDWAFTLKAFGLSDQAIKQAMTAMQGSYYLGRSDELRAQKDHMVTALMEVRQ
jgi:hypothetical protein